VNIAAGVTAAVTGLIRPFVQQFYIDDLILAIFGASVLIAVLGWVKRSS